MCDESKSSDPSGNAKTDPQPLDSPTPVLPIAPQQKVSGQTQAQQTFQNENSPATRKELHVLEKINIFGQLGLVIVGIIAASIYGCQLNQMTKATRASQQSAYAACLGAQISSSALVEAQNSMAETHRATEAATYQALAATQSEAADVTINATQANLQAGKPFTAVFVLKNEGKTAARNMNYVMRLELVPREGRPSLDYPTVASRSVGSARFPAGATYPPTYPQGENIPPDNDALPATRPDGKAFVASLKDVENVRTGKTDLVFYSRISFFDIFGVRHETFYCNEFAKMNVWGTLPHDECRKI